MKPIKSLALVALFLTDDVLGVKLFNATDQLPASMPSPCKDALVADISCTPRLFSAGEVANRLDTNTTDLDQYCNTACVSSLKVR